MGNIVNWNQEIKELVMCSMHKKNIVWESVQVFLHNYQKHYLANIAGDTPIVTLHLKNSKKEYKEACQLNQDG